MQCFGWALIRACILKSHCCRLVSRADPPPPGWCHVCSAKHLQDSLTSFRWWKWGAPWPSGEVMRFYFKVSGISCFTLRMSIRPVATRGLGFWLKNKKQKTKQNTKWTPSSGDYDAHLVLQVNGEVRLEWLLLHFACKPEAKHKETLNRKSEVPFKMHRWYFLIDCFYCDWSRLTEQRAGCSGPRRQKSLGI